MSEIEYSSGFSTLSPELETLLMPEAKPLLLNPKSASDAAIVCLHGYSGTPYEVQPVAQAIAECGMTAIVPLLPKHGYRELQEQEQQFALITKSGLLGAARQEIDRARHQYRYVGAFGFSMGGAIALSMAAEGRLDACVVTAPALDLPRQANILIPLLSWASFTLEAPLEEPFHVPKYEFHHSRALRTLWQIARHARQNLQHIQCPVLGMHSHADPVIPPVVLGLMQTKIPRAIETVWFDDSGHSMQLDVSGGAVAQRASQFFLDHLSTEPSKY